MVLFVAALLVSIGWEESRDWRAFERRPTGVAESTYYYDAARVVRDGDRLRVWIRFEGHLSGLPDPRHLEHREIDCARRRSRIIGGSVDDGLRRPRLLQRQDRTKPIAPASTDAALADLLCV